MSEETTQYATDIPGQPPTPDELGHSGWNILHGAAAVYPYRPSAEQQQAMFHFIHGFSYTYPCNWCAYHMRLYLKDHALDVSNKLTVSRFVCEFHNNVNEHLGKDQYDCDASRLLRRWHPGYPDGMEDKPSMEQRVAEEMERLAEHRKAQNERHEAVLSATRDTATAVGSATATTTTTTAAAAAATNMTTSTHTSAVGGSSRNDDDNGSALRTSEATDRRDAMAWRQAGSSSSPSRTRNWLSGATSNTAAPSEETSSTHGSRIGADGVATTEMTSSHRIGDGHVSVWSSRAQSLVSWFTGKKAAAGNADSATVSCQRARNNDARNGASPTQPTTSSSSHATSAPFAPFSQSSASGRDGTMHPSVKSESNKPTSVKVADEETDIDAILRRLKGCLVYCPEDDAWKAK